MQPRNIIWIDKNEREPTLDEFLESLEERYGHILIDESYMCRLMQLFDELKRGKSLAEAAEAAEFTSGDLVACPPQKKARFVLQSFLESQKDKDSYAIFDRFFPEYNYDAVAKAADADERKDHADGKCHRMISKCKSVLIVRDNDTQQLSLSINPGESDGKFHEQALNHVWKLLQAGNLQVLDRVKEQKAGLLVEAKRSDGLYLVCLHDQADSRIYGYYNNKSGEICWMGIAKNHKAWSNTISQFRKSA